MSSALLNGSSPSIRGRDPKHHDRRRRLLCGQGRREKAGDAIDCRVVEDRRRRHRLLQRLRAFETDTGELLGCAEERPVAVDEAQHGRDRRQRLNADADQGGRDGLDLPREALGEARAVAPADVQAVVGTQEPALAANLYPALVALRVDNEDASGRDDDVVDVSASAGHASVLGRVVLAVTDDPQSTRAWAIGARGEEKLAEALDGIEGLRILNGEG